MSPNRILFTPEGLIVETSASVSALRAGENIRDYIDPHMFEQTISRLISEKEIKRLETKKYFPKGEAIVSSDWKLIEEDGRRMIQIESNETHWISSGGKGKPYEAQPSQFESDRDYALYRWLSTFAEPQPVSIRWIGRWLEVRCDNQVVAAEAAKHHEEILKSGAVHGITILLGSGKEPYLKEAARSISLDGFRVDNKSARLSIEGMEMNKSTIETGYSNWLMNQAANTNVFQAIPGIVLIHRAIDDYRFLAVKSDLSEKRLNKPMTELLNQPLAAIDPLLAEPRRHYIERAAASGSEQSYSYEYTWDSLLWKFNVKVAYLPGYDECLVIVSDAQSWQKEYWLARQ